jgi:outer membrane protein OmpA-like peptidoglycan-associated protein
MAGRLHVPRQWPSLFDGEDFAATMGIFQMRATLMMAFGAVSLAPFAFMAPAQADPAYKADKVTEIFLKDKVAKEASQTRGICIGTAADCPTPKAPPPARFDLLVNFDFDSDRLTKSATENLGEFAKALQDPRLKGQKFEIDGYTDATGDEEYNQGLSERRANAVVSYLTSQGLDASEFVAKGFGKTKPRVSDPYSAENRRVETHLVE